MEEVWKEMIGFDGFLVSSLGNIKNPRTGNIRKPCIGKRSRGYCCVRINRKFTSIHRAVAIAFIPNTEGKPEVNHIDGDKSNNRLENLEWMTRIENLNHAVKIGLIKKGKAIINTETGIIYRRVEDAAKAHGLKPSTLCSKLNGTRKNNNNIPMVYLNEYNR